MHSNPLVGGITKQALKFHSVTPTPATIQAETRSNLGVLPRPRLNPCEPVNCLRLNPTGVTSRPIASKTVGFQQGINPHLSSSGINPRLSSQKTEVAPLLSQTLGDIDGGEGAGRGDGGHDIDRNKEAPAFWERSPFVLHESTRGTYSALPAFLGQIRA